MNAYLTVTQKIGGRTAHVNCDRIEVIVQLEEGAIICLTSGAEMQVTESFEHIRKVLENSGTARW